MNTSGNNRISPEPVLLGYLYQAPHYGYELHKRLEDEFAQIWHASQSQTYNILKRLIENGFITSTSVEQEKLPAKQILQISQAGVERFDTWLHSPTKCSVHTVRVEFITRLYFMRIYYPERVGDMIKVQAEIVDAGIEKLKSRQPDYSEENTINLLAVDLRIKLLCSVREWLTELSSTQTGILIRRGDGE